MTILDKLLEKKDLVSYINLRIECFDKNFRKIIQDAPKKDREKVKQRLIGRIRELKLFKELLYKNEIKYMSKYYWNKNKEAQNGENNRNSV